MKIVVFTDAWVPQVNGVVTHLIGTLSLLAEHHEIHLCTFNEQTPPDFPNSIYLHTARSIPFPIYPDTRAVNPWSSMFEKVIKDVHPEVIHVHTPFTVGAAGVLLSQKLHIPLVMTFHTYLADPEYLKTAGLTMFGLYKNRLIQRAIWWIMGWWYNKADVIISPSKTTQADIQNHFRASIKYEVVSPGVILEKFHNPRVSETDMRKKYGLKREYFLYVGRLSKEKNIDELIEAFYSIAVWQQADLVITGSGPVEEALHSQVQARGMQKYVKFTGKLPQYELQQSGLYNRAVAFVSMSTSETFGMTYVEAMAAGAPIIVVRAKAAPDIFNNNGLMCTPHDIFGFGMAMTQLIEEKDHRDWMKTESLRSAEEHSVKKASEKLEEVYKQLISTLPKPAQLTSAP